MFTDDFTTAQRMVGWKALHSHLAAESRVLEPAVQSTPKGELAAPSRHTSCPTDAVSAPDLSSLHRENLAPLHSLATK